MSERFNVIYADPPWSYNDKMMHRGGAERHYSTMSIDDICALPVASLAADDCALFMWCTWPKLFDFCRSTKTHSSPVLRVLHAWKFEFKTCAFVWVKVNKLTEVNQASFFPADSFDAFWGNGRWTRANSEFCLLATKGKPKRMAADVHQIIYAPIDKHSKKPPETRDRIVRLMGDVSRVELFARQTAPGWQVWGNQVESTADLQSGEA